MHSLRLFRLTGPALRAPSRLVINSRGTPTQTPQTHPSPDNPPTATFTTSPQSLKENMSATREPASSATPQSNVSATGPVSGSPEAQGVNKARAMDDGKGSPDTASTQNPVSDPGEAGAAVSEEAQPSQEEAGGRPEEPAGVKRERVEAQGKRALDAGDK